MHAAATTSATKLARRHDATNQRISTFYRTAAVSTATVRRRSAPHGHVNLLLGRPNSSRIGSSGAERLLLCLLLSLPRRWDFRTACHRRRRRALVRYVGSFQLLLLSSLFSTWRDFLGKSWLFDNRRSHKKDPAPTKDGGRFGLAGKAERARGTAAGVFCCSTK